jgi:thiamine biosynthesis lipoprotein
MLNFEFSSNPINPYVYAHTSTDIESIVKKVNQAVNASSDGNQTRIHVIAADDDYWPLPWYLRGLTQVGYWNYVDESANTASIIIANTEHETQLQEILYSGSAPGMRHLYIPLFENDLNLRPGVSWRGYIRKDLWDRIHTTQDPLAPEQMPAEQPPMSRPDIQSINNLLKFSHQAMNTNFQIYVQETRGTYAGRAARAAFNEVDRLEGLLSRYIENSDISRINALLPGEEAIVDPDTFHCLQTAQQAWQLTDGAFDVTIGNLIKTWKEKIPQAGMSQLPEQSAKPSLELDSEAFSVKVLRDDVVLDLGGIGKGYAVDIIAATLKEWAVERALIHGGNSIVLAFNAPATKTGWPITISNPIDGTSIAQLNLSNEVISSSGLQEGAHIIDPLSGKPVKEWRACWIRLSENAALADTLSTACMVMSTDDIRILSEKVSGIGALLIKEPTESRPAELLQLGNWDIN